MISIKSDRELNLMRKAGKVTALAAQAVCQAVRPGISTGELDALAERIIRGNGAIPAFKGYHGFPGSICASLNGQVVPWHPWRDNPTGRRHYQYRYWCRLEGYGDMAITVPVGKFLRRPAVP